MDVPATIIAYDNSKLWLKSEQTQMLFVIQYTIENPRQNVYNIYESVQKCVRKMWAKEITCFDLETMEDRKHGKTEKEEKIPSFLDIF